MAAKITVQLHIGVTTQEAPVGQTYGGLVVSLEDVNGTQTREIGPDVLPEVDEGGNAEFIVTFDDVQSGASVTCNVSAIDVTGAELGMSVSHTVVLDEVPDNIERPYYQPSFLFIKV
jgi:hypothetical protein